MLIYYSIVYSINPSWFDIIFLNVEKNVLPEVAKSQEGLSGLANCAHGWVRRPAISLGIVDIVPCSSHTYFYTNTKNPSNIVMFNFSEYRLLQYWWCDAFIMHLDTKNYYNTIMDKLPVK